MPDTETCTAAACEFLDADGKVIGCGTLAPDWSVRDSGPLQGEPHAVRLLDAAGNDLGTVPTTHGEAVEREAYGQVRRLAEGLLAGLSRMA